jgi:orotidine-5'-phosphate decarboxylase
MVSFNNRLKKHIADLSSYLCVGLDISPESLGSSSSLSQCIDHANRVIDATIDLAVAFKPNLAFFEQWGSAGYKWLEDTMAYIDNRTFTIAFF